jgi:hypothetical protein
MAELKSLPSHDTTVTLERWNELVVLAASYGRGMINHTKLPTYLTEKINSFKTDNFTISRCFIDIEGKERIEFFGIYIME